MLSRFVLSQASFIFLALMASQNLYAAACCGGAGALPSLITGDEKSLLNSTLLQADLHTRVSNRGVWRRQNSLDQTQTFRLDFARIFQDRFQYGISAPLTSRKTESGKNAASSGWGDLGAQVGYEYLTDWDYHPWRPRGVGYLNLNVPAGTSKYETLEQSEIRGKGFYTMGAGTVFTKQWVRWDALAGAELRRGFSRTFQSSVFNGNVAPGWGRTLTLGGGYHWSDIRVGGTIAWVDEDAKRISSADELPDEDSERFATGSVSVAYSANTEWSGNISYSDQTLFGDPSNTTLSKTWSISLQKRWSR